MRIFRKLKDSDGQSMVELALILPVLLLFFFGIIEFGRVYSIQLILENSVRQAVRTAALGGTNADIKNSAADAAPSLNTTDIKNNLEIDEPDLSDRLTGDPVTVTVEYEVDIIVPFFTPILGDTITLDAESTMRME